MERVSWTPELSVGVERIDVEHQTLVSFLDELGLAIASGSGCAAVLGVVERMRQYALQHFRTEEEAMTATRYPKRSLHISEHDAFIEKVLDLETELEQGGTIQPKELWSFLHTWLSEHIQATDREMGEHLRANGDS